MLMKPKVLKNEAEEMYKTEKADHEMASAELISKLEIGLAQIENGEGIPVKDVRRDC